jgi:hypothetical protein
VPAIAPAATRTDGVQVFDVASAELDRRAYRGLILANGMRVLLASDPAAGKAAAAMNVQVRGPEARSLRLVAPAELSATRACSSLPLSAPLPRASLHLPKKSPSSWHLLFFIPFSRSFPGRLDVQPAGVAGPSPFLRAHALPWHLLIPGGGRV